MVLQKYRIEILLARFVRHSSHNCAGVSELDNVCYVCGFGPCLMSCMGARSLAVFIQATRQKDSHPEKGDKKWFRNGPRLTGTGGGGGTKSLRKFKFRRRQRLRNSTKKFWVAQNFWSVFFQRMKGALKTDSIQCAKWADKCLWISKALISVNRVVSDSKNNGVMSDPIFLVGGSPSEERGAPINLLPLSAIFFSLFNLEIAESCPE